MNAADAMRYGQTMNDYKVLEADAAQTNADPDAIGKRFKSLTMRDQAITAKAAADAGPDMVIPAPDGTSDAVPPLPDEKQ